MANQRLSLAASGQVLSRNANYKYVPKVLVPYLEKIIFIVGFSILAHVSILLVVTLGITIASGEGNFQSIVALISSIVVYTLMPFKQVYFQLRSNTCNDLMDYMNKHFHQRSARGLCGPFV